MASQVCTQCSNVNPADASYCYFDGVRLAGGAGGPVNAGAQNFPSHFVFPSGLVCRNFDQFASTCQQNWDAALGLLNDGTFASFFGAMGRSDLAMAAKEAARFPDLDRGFDQFLAKLPTNTLQDPKLKVEPTEINLGQMSIGTDRTIELRLENVGMRLLYGSVSSDSKWLTLGEAPGNQQKLFQFGSEKVIPLQIRGQHLRASPKPLEGQLLIESNGGKTATVTVRVTVPIIPFKDGVLAGSKSPREIAEKARAKAAEAAPFFESGAMAEWFKRNGWIYPVQGPSANGLGGVQQFFEALGLAKAPKVEVSVKSLSLSGEPGQSASADIGVHTHEKKMVYAHATCEQPWVDVSRVKLAGRTATITVSVPSIPSRPGETLQTRIHIAGNGNQRFSVPLSVAVSAATVAAGAPPSPPIALHSPMAPPSNPFVFADGPSSSAAIVKTPPREREREPLEDKVIDVSKPVPRKKNDFLFHLIPVGVLALFLLGFFIRDCVVKPVEAVGPDGVETFLDPIEEKPKVFLLVDYGKDLKDDKLGEMQKMQHRNMNFGIITNRGKNSKKLFFGARGHTNNILLRINDADSTFGKEGTGEWESPPNMIGWDAKLENLSFAQKEAIGTWKVKGLLITQRVRIIPGESVEVGEDKFNRFYDTCEVTYKVVNKSGKTQEFGMRVLLDTLIGGNDGVPFTIPGESKLIYFKEFSAAKVPDFIMCYENESLADPGIVVQLNLRHALSDRKLEPPDKLLLTKWPGASFENALQLNKMIENWDVPLLDPRVKAPEKPDSSIVLYWNPKPIKKDETRDLGYTYSLSSAAPTGGGRLSMTVGGNTVVGNEITVMAIVSNAKKKETVQLEVPKSLELIEGTEEQKVPEPVEGRPTPITWRLKSKEIGPVRIRAHTTIDTASQAKRILIRPPPIF